MSGEIGHRLWKVLWDYDPNGLVVVDHDMCVTLVNPAFCEMFGCDPETVVGRRLDTLVCDVSDFRRARDEELVIKDKECTYPELELHVRLVVFPIPDENLVAGIVVDLSQEWRRRQVMMQLKRQTLEQVNAVVEKQMSVAQEIASLLGETTAETKVSLVKLRELLNEEERS